MKKLRLRKVLQYTQVIWLVNKGNLDSNRDSAFTGHVTYTGQHRLLLFYVLLGSYLPSKSSHVLLNKFFTKKRKIKEKKGICLNDKACSRWERLLNDK